MSWRLIQAWCSMEARMDDKPYSMTFAIGSLRRLRAAECRATKLRLDMALR
jgi:hypothetical protein